MKNLKIKKQLSEILTEYRLNRDITSLSRKTNISESSVRKASRGETIPRLENLIDLLCVVNNIVEEEYEKKIWDIYALYKDTPVGDHIDSHFKDIKQLKKKYFNKPNNEYKTKKLDDSLINKITDDPISYFIYKMSSNVNHKIFRNDIKSMFGIIGEKKLDELIKSGILLQENHEIKIANKDFDFFQLPYESCKKMIPELLTYFFPKENDGFYFNFSELLSEHTFDKLIEILNDILLEKVKQIVNEDINMNEHNKKTRYLVIVLGTME